MTIPLIIIFMCGIGNFAMHKATMESGHPMVEQMRKGMGQSFGGWGGYLLEFAVLLGAMIFANMESMIALPVYSLYTVFNGVAAWMLFSGKL